MIRPNFNRTKIIATIGPACSSRDTLEKMISRGLDVCRINFSHGSHEEHAKVIEKVREINKENLLHVCFLADLQGPKLRVGEIENNNILLEEGKEIRITTKKLKGTASKISINYKEFAHDVNMGDKILLDDGKIELEVLDTNKNDEVLAKIIYGGELSSRKGVNLPNTKISLPSLTEKDLADLDFALEHDVEWIGLSFVRSPDDIENLQSIIENKGKFTKVIAKIEKPDAIDRIDEIIEKADGIMIARGDLGVEIPLEELPLCQKNIVKKCRLASKPVIIATQIMESMMDNPRPTRAEANDVANAVLDGADALMLSNETSVGSYPIEVIENMEKIINKVEENSDIYNLSKPLDRHSLTYFSDAICQTSVQISTEVNAKAIIGMTKSGYTGFEISSHRPKASVFIFSDNKMLLNTLNLIWGVRGFYYDKFISTDQTFEDVINILKKKNFLHSGEIVINTASMPIHEKNRTNMIKIGKVT